MREKRRKQLSIIIMLLAVAAVLFGCMEPAGAYLTVDPDKCKTCSLCIGVCPSDAVRIVNGKAVIDPTKCIECGRCVEVCPVNAIY